MNIKNENLPPIYKRNGRECYLDPIRKRLIYITPEETVRQKTVSYLLNELDIPPCMVQVEEHLSHYGLDSKDRADIVILERNPDNVEYPLAVIECKAENIPLDDKVLSQAIGYSDALGTMYTVLINGTDCLCYMYEKENDQYVPIEELPKYSAMLTGECMEIKEEPPMERIPFDNLERELRMIFEQDPDSLYAEISKYTPFELALPVFNLWQGLLDETVRMPSGEYGLFRLLEDYGVRVLTYGNAAGGHFFGRYRSFLVSIDGNTEIFSIGLTTYWKAAWVDKEGNMRPDRHPKTCICVAHDDEETSHHALQLVVDDDAAVHGKTVEISHNGRITIGRKGSGKKSDLRELVRQRYPKILKDDRYYLGSISADHLISIDEPETVNLIVNLISYSIVRDEFRSIKKE